MTLAADVSSIQVDVAQEPTKTDVASINDEIAVFEIIEAAVSDTNVLSQITSDDFVENSSVGNDVAAKTVEAANPVPPAAPTTTSTTSTSSTASSAGGAGAASAGGVAPAVADESAAGGGDTSSSDAEEDDAWFYYTVIIVLLVVGGGAAAGGVIAYLLMQRNAKDRRSTKIAPEPDLKLVVAGTPVPTPARVLAERTK